MAYPLETGTTRTATATVVNVPADVTPTATRTWGTTTMAVYGRTSPTYLWRMPMPPATGQTWPRSRPA